MLLYPSGLTADDGLVDLVQKYRKIQSITLCYVSLIIDSGVYYRLVAIYRKQNKKLTINLLDETLLLNGVNYDTEFTEVFRQLVNTLLYLFDYNCAK